MGVVELGAAVLIVNSSLPNYWVQTIVGCSSVNSRPNYGPALIADPSMLMMARMMMMNMMIMIIMKELNYQSGKASWKNQLCI